MIKLVDILNLYLDCSLCTVFFSKDYVCVNDRVILSLDYIDIEKDIIIGDEFRKHWFESYMDIFHLKHSNNVWQIFYMDENGTEIDLDKHMKDCVIEPDLNFLIRDNFKELFLENNFMLETGRFGSKDVYLILDVETIVGVISAFKHDNIQNKSKRHTDESDEDF